MKSFLYESKFKDVKLIEYTIYLRSDEYPKKNNYVLYNILDNKEGIIDYSVDASNKKMFIYATSLLKKENILEILESAFIRFEIEEIKEIEK